MSLQQQGSATKPRNSQAPHPHHCSCGFAWCQHLPSSQLLSAQVQTAQLSLVEMLPLDGVESGPIELPLQSLPYQE